MLCAAGDEKSKKAKNKKMMIFNENVRIPYVRATISEGGRGRIDISQNSFFKEMYVLRKRGTHFCRRRKKREKEKKTEKVKKSVKKG